MVVMVGEKVEEEVTERKIFLVGITKGMIKKNIIVESAN